MSRSYKKEPISKDNQRGGARWGKRQAASRIRNIDPESEEAEVLAGKSNRYKYINQDTYDIHDYISRWTEQDAREYWRNIANGIHERCRFPHYTEDFLKKYPTEDDYIQKVWAKQIRK